MPMPAATRTIAGHAFTLVVGRRYQAHRPMAQRGRTRYTVTITDISHGFSFGSAAVASVKGLDYDAANALLAAFNNGTTSFEGRVWQ